jgi:tRNA(Ile2)-agmatinylcytidine synthase
VAHLGFDDTDSRRGLCTTFLATEFVREFREWDLLGYPRLVRLNPNVPWKTRGNGALYLRFGTGRGTPCVVGEIGGEPVLAYPRGEGAPVDDAFEARVRRVLERWTDFDDPTTHPGYALLHRRPGPRLYWRAVREIVSIGEALAAASGCGRVRGYKEGRGRIGALAAASWRPRDRTYEVLAYRQRSRWGTPRDVDESSVVEMDRRFPSTFNNYDAANRHVVIAPRSPCPVLLGIRGDDPADLPAALAALRTEPVDRWLLYETNQGTDDHLVPANGGALAPRTSVVVDGVVAATPRTVLGGHVVFAVRRPRGDSVECAVYEPAKQLRRVARALRPGDALRVCGAVREAPRTINVEKVAVRSLAPGRRTLAIGWYEPPASARRHLSRPLKRSTARPRHGLVNGSTI